MHWGAVVFVKISVDFIVQRFKMGTHKLSAVSKVSLARQEELNCETN